MKKVHQFKQSRDETVVNTESDKGEIPPVGGDQLNIPYITPLAAPRVAPLSEAGVLDYRVDQSHAGLATKRVRAVVLRKPDSTAFIRVHPDADLTGACEMIEFDRCHWVVHPGIQGALARMTKTRILVPYVTSGGEHGVWPLTTNGVWGATGADAARAGKTHWIKVYAERNAHAYGYEVVEDGPLANLDPLFPRSALQMIMEAINEFRIDTLDHDVALRVLGKKL